MKLVAGLVPALPVRVQASPLATVRGSVQVAVPFALLTITRPIAWLPSTMRMLPTTCRRSSAFSVPMPTLPFGLMRSASPAAELKFAANANPKSPLPARPKDTLFPFTELEKVTFVEEAASATSNRMVAFMLGPSGAKRTCKLLPGAVVFTPKFPAAEMRARSRLPVRKTKACASVVPMKLVAGFVPALPTKPQPLPAGACQLATPLTSLVSTRPTAWLPSSMRMLPTTCRRWAGAVVPMPTFALTDEPFTPLMLPNTTLLLCVASARLPTAVALVSALLTLAENPMAVFSVPVEFDPPLAAPTNVLPAPVLLALPAVAPRKVFKLPPDTMPALVP